MGPPIIGGPAPRAVARPSNSPGRAAWLFGAGLSYRGPVATLTAHAELAAGGVVRLRRGDRQQRAAPLLRHAGNAGDGEGRADRGRVLPRADRVRRPRRIPQR